MSSVSTPQSTNFTVAPVYMTASGANQANANLIPSSLVYVTGTTGGIRLPPARGTGDIITVVMDTHPSNGNILLYPATGEKVGAHASGLSANTATYLTLGTYKCVDAFSGTWLTYYEPGLLGGANGTTISSVQGYSTYGSWTHNSAMTLGSTVRFGQYTVGSLPAGSTAMSGVIVWTTDKKCFAIYGPEGWQRLSSGTL
jgi:hypothetical protein